MELGIVAQRDNDRAIELAADLHEELSVGGVAVRVDPTTAAAIGADPTPVDEMADYPLVVSVGGDGTFLYVARHVGSTPILGVNLGEVGFLNAVPPGEAVDRVREEIEHVRETGQPRFREVARLVARGEGWSQPPGLNEVVVQGPQRGHGRGVDLAVRIDGSTYTAGHADGVLIATPTGSTAYNLSEGGPLIHPSVDGFVVTGMSDEAGMPSLVVPTDADIEVRVSGAEYAVVASDGRQQRVAPPAEVSVGLADEPGRIAGPRSDFFRALGKIERPDAVAPPRNGKA